MRDDPGAPERVELVLEGAVGGREEHGILRCDGCMKMENGEQSDR